MITKYKKYIKFFPSQLPSESLWIISILRRSLAGFPSFLILAELLVLFCDLFTYLLCLSAVSCFLLWVQKFNSSALWGGKYQTNSLSLCVLHGLQTHSAAIFTWTSRWKAAKLTHPIGIHKCGSHQCTFNLPLQASAASPPRRSVSNCLVITLLISSHILKRDGYQ